MTANITLPDSWVRGKCDNCPFSSFIHEKGSPDFYKCFLGYGQFLIGEYAKYFPDIKPHCKLEVEDET